jgi:MoxR-like ATPase
MTALAELKRFSSPQDASAALERAGYLAADELAMSAFLADALEKPLLIEGPAGVGKTALAKAMADALERPLIRMQCYEGLDESRALFEWEYGKQLLYTQMLRPALDALLAGGTSLRDAVDRLAREDSALFDERFLLERPLLAALRSDPPALLLIDEVDRADPEFEALLLELLSDFQISIPELGTIRAVHPPRVILTTNGTREMTEALRRRCLYAYVDYPEPARELAIVRRHVPEASPALAQAIVTFVDRVRTLDLQKTPSISETLDWARALLLLNADALSASFVAESLAVLAKHRDDLDLMRAALKDHTGGQ